MDAHSFIAELDWFAPLPAGAVTALLPATLIKRKPAAGLLSTLIAAVGWIVAPALGLAGLSIGLGVAVHSGHRVKATRDIYMWAAMLLPLVGAVAIVEWADPGGTGAFGWVGRRPLVLAGVCAVVLVAGVWLRRWRTPELDPKRHATPADRRTVEKRDGKHCNYCGAGGDDLGVRLEMDHVIPHARGGRSVVDNFQLLCGPCNGLKSSHSDEDARKLFAKQHGYAAGSYPKNWLQRLLY